MIKTEVYIEGVLADILPNTTIAQTINVLDITDILSRSTDFTNQITLPRTKTNDRIFGFAASEKSLSTRPYSKLSIKVVQNGIETIPEGTCILRSAEDSYKIAIFGKRVDYFDDIKDRKLYELGYLTDGPFNSSTIDTNRTATSDIISAVVDFGMGSGAGFLPLDFYLPIFFYKDLINAILECTGLTMSGYVLTDTTFTNLVVPYSLDEWKYPQVFIDKYSFYAPTVEGTVPTFSTTQKVSGGWGTISGNEAGVFDTAFSKMLIPTVGATGDYLEYTVDIKFNFLASGFTGDSFKFGIIKKRSAVETVLVEQTFSMPGAPASTEDVELTATVDLRDGDEVYLKYTTIIGTPTQTLTKLSFRGTQTGKISDYWVFFNYLLPDNTMDEFLSDFYIHFGIIDNQKQNTLTLKTLEEITNDRSNSVDWTDKRAGAPSIEFDLGYAQSNYFAYNDVLDNNLGRGDLAIDNATLEAEDDLYTSIFENCDYKQRIFINCASIPVYDDTSVDRADFKKSPGLKLLILRDQKSIEDEVNFGSGITDGYKVALFEQPNETVGAGFQRFIDNYYNNISNSLQQLKAVTNYYLLSEVDILNLDRHKLIYDDGAYYLLTKISNFIPGKITKVELLKIV